MNLVIVESAAKAKTINKYLGAAYKHAILGNWDAQITAAYQLALGRAPRSDELKDLSAFARKNGLPNLCRVIFNSNEFMFIN